MLFSNLLSFENSTFLHHSERKIPFDNWKMRGEEAIPERNQYRIPKFAELLSIMEWKQEEMKKKKTDRNKEHCLNESCLRLFLLSPHYVNQNTAIQRNALHIRRGNPKVCMQIMRTTYVIESCSSGETHKNRVRPETNGWERDATATAKPVWPCMAPHNHIRNIKSLIYQASELKKQTQCQWW